MKQVSNKTFFVVMMVCLSIIISVIAFIKIDSSRYLNEKQITKSINNYVKTNDNGNGNSVSTPKTSNILDGNGLMYSCNIWDSDYNAVMEGLRYAFNDLSKKENTGYNLIVVNLNDARRDKGHELVYSFALYVEDLYGVDWNSVTTYEQFKNICNIE